MSRSTNAIYGALSLGAIVLSFIHAAVGAELTGWGTASLIAVPEEMDSNVTKVVCGRDSTVCLLENGQAFEFFWTGAFQTIEAPEGQVLIDIATSYHHSLALTNAGRAIAWGSNRFGVTDVPESLTNVVAIAAGGSSSGDAHSLALTGEGEVVAWGHNGWGQSEIPAEAANIVAIAASGAHSIALTAEGKLLSWGKNNAGQTEIPRTPGDIVDVAAALLGGVALRRDGTVIGWGSRLDGVPGDLADVIAVSTGTGGDVLAVTDEGRVVSWGGSLTTPTELEGVVQASVGNNHGFALISAEGSIAPQYLGPAVSIGTVAHRFHERILVANNPRTLSVEGLPLGLQFDSDTGVISGTPEVSGVFEVQVEVANAWGADEATITIHINHPSPQILTTVLSAGLHSHLDVMLETLNLSDGSRYVFEGLPPGLAGNESEGRIVGRPTEAGDFSVTASITNQYGIQRIDHFVIRVSPVYVWEGTSDLAFNYADWLIDDLGERFTPLPPLDLPSLRAISAGCYHVLAVREDGTLLAWGDNSLSQLDIPASLNEQGTVISVAAGCFHSVALTADGEIHGWGNYPPEVWWLDPVPADVPTLSNIRAIDAGNDYSLALSHDGEVTAWGSPELSEPAVLSVPEDLSNVVQISAGWFHCLALTDQGEVIAWGSNDYGESTVPNFPGNVVAIDAGLNASLAATDDGQIIEWGAGIVGDTAPPPIEESLKQIEAGVLHKLALTASGRVYSWGTESTDTTFLSNVKSISTGLGFNAALIGEVPVTIEPTLTMTEEVQGQMKATIKWTGQLEHTYQVQVAPEPYSTLWQDLGAPVTVTSSGEMAVFTEIVHALTARRFYRVVRQ